MSKNAKKKARENFREAVFKRDNYKCRLWSSRHPCDKTGILEAHHITDRHEMPNGGYVVENGITLCPKHHKQVEDQGVKARHRLYIIIRSHPETARKASERLQ